MILAQPLQLHNSVNSASGNSDPLSERQIDSLQMAANFSVGAVSVNVRAGICSVLHLSFSHNKCLLGFFSFLSDSFIFPSSRPHFYCLIVSLYLRRDRKATPVHLDSPESP